MKCPVNIKSYIYYIYRDGIYLLCFTQEGNSKNKELNEILDKLQHKYPEVPILVYDYEKFTKTYLNWAKISANELIILEKPKDPEVKTYIDEPQIIEILEKIREIRKIYLMARNKRHRNYPNNIRNIEWRPYQRYSEAFKKTINKELENITQNSTLKDLTDLEKTSKISQKNSVKEQTSSIADIPKKKKSKRKPIDSIPNFILKEHCYSKEKQSLNEIRLKKSQNLDNIIKSRMKPQTVKCQHYYESHKKWNEIFKPKNKCLYKGKKKSIGNKEKILCEKVEKIKKDIKINENPKNITDNYNES